MEVNTMIEYHDLTKKFTRRKSLVSALALINLPEDHKELASKNFSKENSEFIPIYPQQYVEIKNKECKLRRENSIINHCLHSKQNFCLSNISNTSDEFLQNDVCASANMAIDEYIKELRLERDSSFFRNFEKVLVALLPSGQVDIKYMCQMHDNSWAIISNTNISNIILKGESEFTELYDVPFANISRILIEPDLAIIHISLSIMISTDPKNPDGCLSPLGIDMIFKNSDKCNNRHFISSLIVAIAKSRRSKSVSESVHPPCKFVDVIRLPSLLEFPSCQNMKIHMLGEKVLQIGHCLTYCKEVSPNFSEEFMLQKGNDNYKPVLITLEHNRLIISSRTNAEFYKHTQDVLRVNTHEILSVRRVENPRPHSLDIIWKSMTLHLAGSNSCIVGQLYDHIQAAMRSYFLPGSPQLAHIVVTDVALLLFSSKPDKVLLLRTPLLNISKTDAYVRSRETGEERDYVWGYIIETDGLEADEDILSSDYLTLQWFLLFDDKTELEKFLDYLLPCL